MRQRRQRVGRVTAGGDADHTIQRAEIERCHVALAQIGAIFRILGRCGPGERSSGDAAHDQIGGDVKRGRTLRRVERAQTARCARANVDHPATLPHARRDAFDSQPYLWQRLRDGARHPGVLRVHHLRDLEGTHAVNVQRRGVDTLALQWMRLLATTRPG